MERGPRNSYTTIQPRSQCFLCEDEESSLAQGFLRVPVRVGFIKKKTRSSGNEVDDHENEIFHLSDIYSHGVCGQGF